MTIWRIALLLAVLNAIQADVKIGIKRKAQKCGLRSKMGDILHVDYKGMLSNGKEFDSSRYREEPFAFAMGTGQVIEGWEKGLMGMCETEIRKLTVPPELAYGEHGVPPVIEPNATLTFEVELIKIERQEKDL